MQLDQEYSPATKYEQIILLAFFAVITFMRVNLWIAPSPLMTIIMEELSITYAESGMLLTTVTLVMGLFLYVGSAMIDRLGNVAAMNLSVACLVLDGLIVFFTSSYVMLLVGRVMTGIGHGLSSGAMASLVSERFSPKQHGLVNSFNIAVNGVSTAAVYIITAPLLGLLGSWRSVMLLWSIASLVVLALFLLFGKKNPGPASLPRQRATGEAKGPSSLRKAVKIKEVWYFTVAMVGAFFVYNALVAYLPSFLTLRRGFSVESAGFVTSLMSFGGIAGSLVCGVISTKVVRKHLLIAWIFLITAVAYIGIALATNHALLYLCIAVAGVGFSGWLPVSLTAIMQLRGMTPQLIGGANAIYLSIGSLATFLVPLVFQKLEFAFGMQTALLLFGLSLAPSLASMLLYPKATAQ